LYRIVYTKQAVKDIINLKSAGLDIKVKELIGVIRENPFRKPPAYEPLTGNLKGFFSRRINIQHRLVYQVHAGGFEESGVKYDGTVKIVSMWSHYDKM